MRIQAALIILIAQGLAGCVEEVSTDKEGYESSKSLVSITGDTRFDIQIVRR
jgi:hypothetical protein